MTLIQGKKGDRLFVKDIKERKLDSRLLSLGLCRSDEFIIENIANGNILIKTVETKIVLSRNLAEKIDVEESVR